MKKTLIILGLVVLVFGSWLASSYNNLVDVDENANKAFAHLEADLQRRYDLIPNFVETVKGVANFEQDTLTAVVEARSAWAKAGTQNEKVEASNQMESALSRLLVTVEAYPELKATESYVNLQVELSGTENRIKQARRDYNEAATTSNKLMRSFPTNIIASIFGFERHELFEATEGADTAPKVNFTE